MQLIDTHCHIQSVGAQAGERSTRELWSTTDLNAETIIANALNHDVERMVCVGCDIDDSRLAIAFVADRPQCVASIGIHPHEATKHRDDFEDFAALVTSPKVVAIGECGLDYFYEHSVREDQIAILQQQLDLAVAHNLPVIFHVRQAFEDFWPLFDSYPTGAIRGVLHSFTDTEDHLQQAIDRGLYIGVNGIATFAKSPAQQAMYQAIPLENLLLETDAPFLTPVPYRGKINEPKQIRTIAEFMSQLKNETLEDLAAATTHNARALFDI